jgi:hypothetical protein
MNSPELFLISVARVWVEMAGFTLLGQGVLTIFAGRARDSNVVYRLMQIVSSPAVKLARLMTPRSIIDRHVPLVAFFLLFWLWIGLAIVKSSICMSQGLDCSS